MWLALLLKRQRRANILPPPWLLPSSLERILKQETDVNPQTFSPPPPHPYLIRSSPSHTDTISPPFLPSSTANAPSDYLPYHWLELGEILLEACSDDLQEPGFVISNPDLCVVVFTAFGSTRKMPGNLNVELSRKIKESQMFAREKLGKLGWCLSTTARVTRGFEAYDCEVDRHEIGR